MALTKVDISMLEDITAGTKVVATAPGASGQVLTSDGTNWTSATPAAGGAWTEGCFADLSVDKTVANSTGTQVQLDREQFDIGSNFNTSTWVYTIPSDGYYFVHWQVGWGVPRPGRFESWITKNNVQAFIPDGFSGIEYPHPG